MKRGVGVGIAGIVHIPARHFGKAERAVEADGLLVGGVDLQRQLSLQSQRMGDQLASDAQTLPVGRNEDPADKITEQA
jgi:hypothetical protein